MEVAKLGNTCLSPNDQGEGKCGYQEAGADTIFMTLIF